MEMTYLLEPAAAKVTIISEDDPPSGLLTTLPHRYDLAFEAQGTWIAAEARINRYTGEMLREMGAPPFFTDDISPTEGNVSQTWKCKSERVGPGF